MPLDLDEIFCIVCGKGNDDFDFPEFTSTTFGFKCSDCYIFDKILTPNGVITLTNYFDENNYFEFYDSHKTLVNINEGLWAQPVTYKLPKPKKTFRRRRIARHRSN